MRLWKPCVIWMTGLSGAGKTTLADAVRLELRGFGQMTVNLDGDNLRDIYGRRGFDKESRMENIRQVAELASVLQKLGVTSVVSLISPYIEAREEARFVCSDFFEVYVSTSLKVCEERDPKGLYAMAREGGLKGFTGLDDPYESPVSPDLTVDTNMKTVTYCSRLILDCCFRRFNP